MSSTGGWPWPTWRNWPLILRARQAVGYHGPLILEPAHVEDPAIFLRARDFVQQAWTDVARTDR